MNCLLGFALVILPYVGLVWNLPDSGGVQALLSEGGPDLSFAELPAAQGWAHSGGCWTKRAGGTWKRMRLTKKTDGSLVRRHGFPHVFHGVRWKRLRSHDEVLGFEARSDKRGRFSLHERGIFPREGVGLMSPWLSHCSACLQVSV